MPQMVIDDVQISTPAPAPVQSPQGEIREFRQNEDKVLAYLDKINSIVNSPFLMSMIQGAKKPAKEQPQEAIGVGGIVRADGSAYVAPTVIKQEYQAPVPEAPKEPAITVEERGSVYLDMFLGAIKEGRDRLAATKKGKEPTMKEFIAEVESNRDGLVKLFGGFDIDALVRARRNTS